MPDSKMIDWHPFIDCAATGIPDKIVSDALLFAARMCLDCRYCHRTCGCGYYLKNSLAIINRFIRNWDRQRFIELHRKATWVEKERPGVSIGYAWVLEDGMRGPHHRHPESKGFEIDHVEGERWRRFKR
jgi:hypothetical protein